MARSRVLRPTTIIPDALYVRRSADRQLDQVVDDMGRPGYILVARQMGKTNLLLHMKRRHEEDGHVVIYVDLSERFEGARNCFRSIIDLAFETRPDLLDDARSSVAKIRSQQDNDASSEYGKSLREILKVIKNKKLIIILDEIDSLVNANYSDVILSQVRSMYFLRTNFEDYNRLTYVLSGVAEPSDLIKDKNISPFNIGEKIYLYDFSFDEFVDFVFRANLDISDSVIEEIYKWTGGNPRMTWDVCAALEERISNGANVSLSDVEGVVQKLYLETFDLPPVDHMRSLVAGDVQLRSALVALRYGKGGALDDRTRNRLYLAGITDTADKTLKIKSPIIDIALSESWLNHAANAADPLASVPENFAGERYQAVMKAFTQFQNEGGDLLTTPVGLQFNLALSQFRTNNFDNSIDTFRILLGRTRGDLRTTVLYHLGSAFVMLGKYADAIPYLNEGAYDGSGSLKSPAKMLLATALYKADKANLQTAKDILSDVLAGISIDVEDTSDADIRASALYDLSVTSREFGDFKSARYCLEQAASLASLSHRPGIIISNYSFAADKKYKRALVEDAYKAILSGNLKISSSGTSPIKFSEKVLAAIFSALLIEGLKIQSNQLLSYSEQFFPQLSPIEIVLRFAREARESYSSEVILPILNFALEIISPDARHDIKIELYRLLSMYTEGDLSDMYAKIYLEEFRNSQSRILTDDDSIFMVGFAQRLIARPDYDEALALVEDLEPYLPISTTAYLWPILLYIRMTSLIAKSAFEEARITARDLIESVNDEQVIRGAISELASVYSNLSDHARKFLTRSNNLTPDPLKRIGRNEKVKVKNKVTGEVQIVKFKFVEDKVRAGELDLIKVIGEG